MRGRKVPLGMQEFVEQLNFLVRNKSNKKNSFTNANLY